MRNKISVGKLDKDCAIAADGIVLMEVVGWTVIFVDRLFSHVTLYKDQLVYIYSVNLICCVNL